MTPSDYENCKEHLPLPHFITFNPQNTNTKPETSGDFTRPVLRLSCL